MPKQPKETEGNLTLSEGAGNTGGDTPPQLTMGNTPETGGEKELTPAEIKEAQDAQLQALTDKIGDVAATIADCIEKGKVSSRKFTDATAQLYELQQQKEIIWKQQAQPWLDGFRVNIAKVAYNYVIENDAQGVVRGDITAVLCKWTVDPETGEMHFDAVINPQSVSPAKPAATPRKTANSGGNTGGARRKNYNGYRVAGDDAIYAGGDFVTAYASPKHRENSQVNPENKGNPGYWPGNPNHIKRVIKELTEGGRAVEVIENHFAE